MKIPKPSRDEIPGIVIALVLFAVIMGLLVAAVIVSEN